MTEEGRHPILLHRTRFNVRACVYECKRVVEHQQDLFVFIMAMMMIMAHVIRYDIIIWNICMSETLNSCDNIHR